MTGHYENFSQLDGSFKLWIKVVKFALDLEKLCLVALIVSPSLFRFSERDLE